MKIWTVLPLLLLLTGCACAPTWFHGCRKGPQPLCPGVVEVDGRLVCTKPAVAGNTNPCACGDEGR